MESYFDVIAQSPHCLLAVDTEDGGKWKSNFNENWVMPSAPSGTGSFEETHGVLKKVNVTTENNYFKAYPLPLTGISKITTAINLNGYSGDFTMLAKVFYPATADTNTIQMLMQNATYFGIVENKTKLQFNYQDMTQNRWIAINYIFPADFDWSIPHVYSCTRTANKRSLFIDGVQVATSSTTTSYMYAGAKEFLELISSYSVDVRSSNFMLFDKALSDDEIKILSDSLLPKVVEFESETELLCTTPTNLTSNTSNADWECYTQSLNADSDGNTANAYLAASGGTTEGARWKNTYAAGSAGVRFVWKRTDLAEWAVKQIKIGNTITSVMPQRIQSFTLQGSNDNSTWSDVGGLQTQAQPTFNTYTENTFSYSDNTSKFKYWGILCNNVTYPEISPTGTVAAANLIQFTNEI